MKRFILALFIISLFASCLTEVKENEKTPEYSTMVVSFVHRDSFKFEGVDHSRNWAYIKTLPDTALAKEILEKYPMNVTQSDSVKLVYEYFDNDTTDVKPMQFEHKIKRLF
jgi:F0F1-type ATP synthase gamma subunit